MSKKIKIPKGYRIVRPTEYLEYDDLYIDLDWRSAESPWTGFRAEDKPMLLIIRPAPKRSARKKS